MVVKVEFFEVSWEFSFSISFIMASISSE